MTADHDLDQLLRAHTDDAAATAPEPSWERLEARIAEGVPVALTARPVPRRRRPLLVAAAAVLVIGGVAGGLWLREDAGEPVRTVPAGEGPTTSAPTTEAVSPTTEAVGSGGTATSTPGGVATTAVIGTGALPQTAVVLVDHDGDGAVDLVRLEGLGVGGPPRVTVLVSGLSPDPEIPELGGYGPAKVDVGGGRAYVETCCEPAVGEIFAYDLVTGERVGEDPVVYGVAPAISVTGELAHVALNELRTVGVRPGVGNRGFGPAVEIEGERYAADLAWSPTGLLARTTIDHEGSGTDGYRVEVLDPSDHDPGWQPVGSEEGRGLAFPTFLADGRLVVGTDLSVDGDGVIAGGLAVVDPTTGMLEPRYRGLALRDLDATPDGRWLLAAEGGTLRAFDGVDLGDRGTVAQVEGEIRGLAW